MGFKKGYAGCNGVRWRYHGIVEWELFEGSHEIKMCDIEKADRFSLQKRRLEHVDMRRRPEFKRNLFLMDHTIFACLLNYSCARLRLCVFFVGSCIDASPYVICIWLLDHGCGRQLLPFILCNTIMMFAVFASGVMILQCSWFALFSVLYGVRGEFEPGQL